MTGRALVVQADALRLPLPDECVDLVIFSPPYWSLRRYDVEGIGNEATPLEWLEALWAATAECKRVLKPTGSIFVNLGDKYSGGGGYAPDAPSNQRPGALAGPRHSITSPKVQHGIRDKSLLGLPGLYAAGCSGMLAAIGGPDPGLNLIWRRDQITEGTWIWHKLNGLPDSATDRTGSAHEYVFHLTKQPRYYAALDTLREPYEAKPQRRFSPRKIDRAVRPDGALRTPEDYIWEEPQNGTNPLGKLPGSVWPIASDPLRLPAWLGVEHYAAFPPELPRRLILGFSPPGICCECGQGRWPVVEREKQDEKLLARRGQYEHRRGDLVGMSTGSPLRANIAGREWRAGATILGWACACTPSTLHPGTGEPSGEYSRYAEALADGTYEYFGPQYTGGPRGLLNRPKVGPWREYHLDGWKAPPTRPAVVADVFGGTGTTALVARALGRIGLSLDLSHAYSRAARYRIFESGEWQDIIARTTGRKVKPLPKHDPNQGALL